MLSWKVYALVFLATVFESVGDALVRVSLSSPSWGYRVALFALGAALLVLYGTTLNIAPVQFEVVVGIYIAMLFIMFQITNFVILRHKPTLPSVVGGAFILCGGALISFWKS